MTECEGCKVALRSVAACHAELDALEAYRLEMFEALVAVLEQTEQWEITKADEHAEMGGRDKEKTSNECSLAIQASKTRRTEEGFSVSEVTMSGMMAKLAARVRLMHHRLLHLVEEKALFLDGLDIFSSKLRRLEFAASACRGELPGSQHWQEQEQRLRMARHDLGNKGGGEMEGETTYRVGALASVWIALREKEGENDLLKSLLLKIEGVWHVEERERAEEKHEMKAELVKQEVRINFFKVFSALS